MPKPVNVDVPRTHRQGVPSDQWSTGTMKMVSGSGHSGMIRIDHDRGAGQVRSPTRGAHSREYETSDADASARRLRRDIGLFDIM